MNLKSYLTENELTETAFADAIGVRQVTVNRWVNGKRFPEPEMVMRITEATNGKVTFEDWYNRAAAKVAAE